MTTLREDFDGWAKANGLSSESFGIRSEHQFLEIAWQAYQDAHMKAVPDGWQLVPKEPTKEMRKASLSACAGKVYQADMVFGPMAMNADRYRAMLAVAPHPVIRKSLRTDSAAG